MEEKKEEEKKERRKEREEGILLATETSVAREGFPRAQKRGGRGEREREKENAREETRSGERAEISSSWVSLTGASLLVRSS